MANNTASASASSGSIGIFGLLTAILLVFKLAGMGGASWGLANLSWFWVFAPLGFGILLSLFFIGLMIFLIAISSR